MKIKLLMLLLILVLASGCASLPKPDFEPDGPALRVVTYNINWGFSTPYKVVRYLIDADADIICLQETHGYWEAFLKKYLAMSYPYSSFHSAGGAGGIAFMSKYELNNVKAIEAEAGWFPALYAEVMTDIGTVQFLNVHLKPPLSESGSATVSAYYESTNVHQKEIAHFLKGTDMNAPLIIAGDFNENERKKAIRTLLNHGFTDALSLYDKKSYTWLWRVMPGITLKNRYDHIVFSKHFSCTGAQVSDIRASDHEPVMAVFMRSRYWAKQQFVGDAAISLP